MRKVLKLLGIATNSEDEMVRLSETSTVTPEDLEALGDYIGAEKWRSKLHGSVRAFNVSKTFSTVQAVHEVSLSAYPGQVLALLGHNGAGKSTMVNMMTGVMIPTHGYIFTNGLDIEDDVAEIQQIVSVCPQEDLLWDELTAWQHLQMYAALKGLGRWS